MQNDKNISAASRLCKAYGIKASKVIQDMEEEPSEDDGFSLGILRFMSCQFWALCLVSFGKYPFWYEKETKGHQD